MRIRLLFQYVLNDGRHVRLVISDVWAYVASLVPAQVVTSHAETLAAMVRWMSCAVAH